MKRFLFIPLLFLGLFAQAQIQGTAPVTYSTRADLKTTAAQDRAQVEISGLLAAYDTNGGRYMWDAASTATDDGFLTISVTGVSTGRWVRLGNSNSIKGSTTFSGTLLTTSYTVNYVIGGVTTVLPFVPAQIYLQPRTQGAAQPSWITNITASGFTINYTTVPIIGTLNIVNDYLVIKQ